MAAGFISPNDAQRVAILQALQANPSLAALGQQFQQDPSLVQGISTAQAPVPGIPPTGGGDVGGMARALAPMFQPPQGGPGGGMGFVRGHPQAARLQLQAPQALQSVGAFLMSPQGQQIMAMLQRLGTGTGRA